MPKKEPRRQKVLIIGAGPAGMSCAEMLAREPDKYLVTVLERDSMVGGQATSLAIDSSKHGADWVNNSVQFASPNTRHAFRFLREYGYEPHELKHQMAFGRGKDNFWTNVFPTPLAQKHEDDILKFGRAIKLLRFAPRCLWAIPLSTYLRIFRIDKEFAEKIIYPLASSLIPIGNYSEKIPVGLAQWLFEEGRRDIWDYGVKSALPKLPSIYTFPNMGKFYQDWAEGLRAKGVKIRVNTQVLQVIRRDKNDIVVETRSVDEDDRLSEEGCRDRNITESFDKLVICIHGDEAKRILGKQATRTEKKALGRVKFFDDLTLTHSDHVYFQRKYEAFFKEELCAKPSTPEEEERIKFAKGEKGIRSGFKPAYCSFSYQSRPDKIEVAYDCSNLQYQFQQQSDNEPAIPFDRHVFQSHFMDSDLKHLWTVDQINDKSVIERKWWRSPFQTWRHWLRVVPLMKSINGTKNTVYAGGWTLVNIYEGACVSGIAAACRLGARYEGFEPGAEKTFSMYYQQCHGGKYKRHEGKPNK